MEYDFEWNPNKAASNQRKHGVAFNQAVLVFKDPMALTIYDNESSIGEEERWITLGQVDGRIYLLVVHTYQDIDSNRVKIRVISARKASKSEITQYEQG